MNLVRGPIRSYKHLHTTLSIYTQWMCMCVVFPSIRLCESGLLFCVYVIDFGIFARRNSILLFLLLLLLLISLYCHSFLSFGVYFFYRLDATETISNRIEFQCLFYVVPLVLVNRFHTFYYSLFRLPARVPQSG